MTEQLPCGKIQSVQMDSVAGRAGLQPGDCLVAINGGIVHDVIDVQFYSAEEDIELEFLREGERMVARVARGYDEPLGLEFSDILFDGIRTCCNRCEFCFVAQMPKGLRRSLYVRDDDYRLSFLTGSFVTLTNLTEEDWGRIEAQGLSPLYVSVHATDPVVRAKILGRANIPDIREQLARLGEMGVEVHTQVVLVPGINDGAALAQTLADLSVLHPSVASVSLVPVGLTQFRRRQLSAYDHEEAKALLAQAKPWWDKFKRDFGVNFAYPSDEFYLLSGASVPPASEYNGFPQLENGVGLVRRFLEDWRRTKRKVKQVGWPSEQRHMTWVTGTLFAGELERAAEWLRKQLDITIEVVAVTNRLFGPSVTVAGLLTAEDVADALRDRALGDAVWLPRAMLDDAGRVTLDDRTPAWLESHLEVAVEFAEKVSEMLRL